MRNFRRKEKPQDIQVCWSTMLWLSTPNLPLFALLCYTEVRSYKQTHILCQVAQGSACQQKVLEGSFKRNGLLILILGWFFLLILAAHGNKQCAGHPWRSPTQQTSLAPKRAASSWVSAAWRVVFYLPAPACGTSANLPTFQMATATTSPKSCDSQLSGAEGEILPSLFLPLVLYLGPRGRNCFPYLPIPYSLEFSL